MNTTMTSIDEPRTDVPTDAPALPGTPPKQPPRRPMRTLGLGLLIALLGFGGGVGGYAAADQWLGDDETPTVTAGADAGSSSAADALRTASTNDELATTNEGFSPRDIYKAVSPAVVHIATVTKGTSTGFFGLESGDTEGTGSGFVIDDKGYIVTNAHVVDGADTMTVTFGSDGTAIDAKLVGEDPSSDIAVIKIDPQSKDITGGLRTVGFGDSGKLQVGDPVIAIGNPFGLDRTLTTGVVSALQREIPALNEFAIDNVIQTDAAVNPGNSGGPLLNERGEVIGVNSQIQSKSGGFDGIAFAVPSSTVQGVVKQLIDKGSVQYAYLGVAGGELTEEMAKELDLSVTKGVLIGEVTKGSPADKAGLVGSDGDSVVDGQSTPRGGDVILTFDGKDVTTMREVASIVDGKEPGDTVDITLLRKGKRVDVTVTLGARPTEVTADTSNQ